MINVTTADPWQENISNNSLNSFSISLSSWSYIDLLWTFAFSIIVLTSIVGNCLVIWIVTAHRRMWSVTNYFLVNLAAADILMATFNCIFSFIYMRDREWHYGSIYCSVNQFLSLCSVPASVLTMLAITLDRRRAIMSPLRPRTTRLMALVILAIIWTVSSLIAIPPTVNAKTFTLNNSSSGGIMVCIVVWPDGAQGYSTIDLIYNLVYFVLTYVFPLAIMMVAYIQMGRKLWGQQNIGEDTPTLAKCRKTKQKVVKMFGAVTCIFTICWFPYHAYFIYSYFNPGIMKAWFTQHMYLGFYWLAMANCCVNPIVYYAMNKRFRFYFQQVLCCCCFPRTSQSPHLSQWRYSVSAMHQCSQYGERKLSNISGNQSNLSFREDL